MARGNVPTGKIQQAAGPARGALPAGRSRAAAGVSSKANAATGKVDAVMRKFPPIDVGTRSKCEVISKFLRGMPEDELPAACGEMLAAGVEMSLGVKPKDRDVRQAAVCRFIGRVLQFRVEALEANIKNANEGIASAKAKLTLDLEIATSEVDKAKDGLKSAEELAVNLRVAHSEVEAKTDAAASLAASKEAVRNRGEADHLAAELERDLCEAGCAQILRGECAGDMDTIKEVASLQVIARKANAEESLVLMLPTMAKKTPDDRSGLEKVAAKMLEETFSKHSSAIGERLAADQESINKSAELAEEAQAIAAKEKKQFEKSAKLMEEAEVKAKDAGNKVVQAQSHRDACERLVANLEAPVKKVEAEFRSFQEGVLELYWLLYGEERCTFANESLLQTSRILRTAFTEPAAATYSSTANVNEKLPQTSGFIASAHVAARETREPSPAVETANHKAELKGSSPKVIPPSCQVRTTKVSPGSARLAAVVARVQARVQATSRSPSLAVSQRTEEIQTNTDQEPDQAPSVVASQLEPLLPISSDAQPSNSSEPAEPEQDRLAPDGVPQAQPETKAQTTRIDDLTSLPTEVTEVADELCPQALPCQNRLAPDGAPQAQPEAKTQTTRIDDLASLPTEVTEVADELCPQAPPEASDARADDSPSLPTDVREVVDELCPQTIPQASDASTVQGLESSPAKITEVVDALCPQAHPEPSDRFCVDDLPTLPTETGNCVDESCLQAPPEASGASPAEGLPNLPSEVNEFVDASCAQSPPEASEGSRANDLASLPTGVREVVDELCPQRIPQTSDASPVEGLQSSSSEVNEVVDALCPQAPPEASDLSCVDDLPSLHTETQNFVNESCRQAPPEASGASPTEDLPNLPSEVDEVVDVSCSQAPPPASDSSHDEVVQNLTAEATELVDGTFTQTPTVTVIVNMMCTPAPHTIDDPFIQHLPSLPTGAAEVSDELCPRAPQVSDPQPDSADQQGISRNVVLPSREGREPVEEPPQDDLSMPSNPINDLAESALPVDELASESEQSTEASHRLHPSTMDLPCGAVFSETAVHTATDNFESSGVDIGRTVEPPVVVREGTLSHTDECMVDRRECTGMVMPHLLDQGPQDPEDTTSSTNAIGPQDLEDTTSSTYAMGNTKVDSSQSQLIDPANPTNQTRDAAGTMDVEETRSTGELESDGPVAHQLAAACPSRFADKVGSEMSCHPSRDQPGNDADAQRQNPNDVHKMSMGPIAVSTTDIGNQIDQHARLVSATFAEETAVQCTCADVVTASMRSADGGSRQDHPDDVHDAGIENPIDVEAEGFEQARNEKTSTECFDQTGCEDADGSLCSLPKTNEQAKNADADQRWNEKDVFLCCLSGKQKQAENADAVESDADGWRACGTEMCDHAVSNLVDEHPVKLDQPENDHTREIDSGETNLGQDTDQPDDVHDAGIEDPIDVETEGFEQARNEKTSTECFDQTGCDDAGGSLCSLPKTNEQAENADDDQRWNEKDVPLCGLSEKKKQAENADAVESDADGWRARGTEMCDHAVSNLVDEHPAKLNQPENDQTREIDGGETNLGQDAVIECGSQEVENAEECEEPRPILRKKTTYELLSISLSCVVEHLGLRRSQIQENPVADCAFGESPHVAFSPASPSAAENCCVHVSEESTREAVEVATCLPEDTAEEVIAEEEIVENGVEVDDNNVHPLRQTSEVSHEGNFVGDAAGDANEVCNPPVASTFDELATDNDRQNEHHDQPDILSPRIIADFEVNDPPVAIAFDESGLEHHGREQNLGKQGQNLRTDLVEGAEHDGVLAVGEIATDLVSDVGEVFTETCHMSGDPISETHIDNCLQDSATKIVEHGLQAASKPASEDGIKCAANCAESDKEAAIIGLAKNPASRDDDVTGDAVDEVAVASDRDDVALRNVIVRAASENSEEENMTFLDTMKEVGLENLKEIHASIPECTSVVEQEFAKSDARHNDCSIGYSPGGASACTSTSTGEGENKCSVAEIESTDELISRKRIHPHISEDIAKRRRSIYDDDKLEKDVVQKDGLAISDEAVKHANSDETHLGVSRGFSDVTKKQASNIGENSPKRRKLACEADCLELPTSSGRFDAESP